MLLQAARPGVQGHRRAAQRVLRDLVHARPRRSTSPADFNAQFSRLAGPGRTPGSCARSRPARSTWSTPTGPRCCRCRRSRCSLGWRQPDPAGPRLLRPPRHQRLLRRPDRDRPDGRRHRRPGPGRVRLDGRLVADHARVWARGMTVTDPAHVAAAKRAARAVPAAPRRRRSARRPGPGPGRLRPRLRPRRRPTRSRRLMAAKQTRRPSEAVKQIHLPRRRVEGAPDHRGRRPARRPGPRRRLDPRGLPRRGARTRSRRPATPPAPQLRIRAAGFPARKTLDDFDWDAQPAVRQQVAALASGGVPHRGPQRRAARPARHRQDPPRHRRSGIVAAHHGHRVLFATATDWVTRLTDAHRARPAPRTSSPGCAATG